MSDSTKRTPSVLRDLYAQHKANSSKNKRLDVSERDAICKYSSELQAQEIVFLHSLSEHNIPRPL